jgi:tRNASer (uridine44-2'-O)-methyltransferase
MENEPSKGHSESGLPLKFIGSLNLGGDGSHTSSYSIYRIWLAALSLHCGWEVECEMLRIPSTRNWAIAGASPPFSQLNSAETS